MQTNSTIPFAPSPEGLSYVFGLQAQRWLAGLVTQRRKPLSPATISAFTSYVRRLVPMIGAEKPLADINSGTLRDLVTQLVAEELSAKTIGELVATVKQVVASAVDGNGDPIFPRQWNVQAHRCAFDWQSRSSLAFMCEDVERCYQERVERTGAFALRSVIGQRVTNSGVFGNSRWKYR